MTKLIKEDANVDIGKLLGLKVRSFVETESEPGDFFLKGKKLFFEAPIMDGGEDYETTVTITYADKRGKAVTKDFDFVIADSDGTNSSMAGDDGPNSILLNYAGTKKHFLIYTLAGDDKVDAGNGNDKVYAGDGDDEIYVYDGNDKVFGEAGNDTINAGFGTNTVNGGDGDDLIFIRGENDVVTGGAGIDSFGAYNLATSQTIKDFVSGVDKLYYEEARFQETQFASIATKTATGTLLTFDADTTILLEGFFL